MLTGTFDHVAKIMFILCKGDYTSVPQGPKDFKSKGVSWKWRFHIVCIRNNEEQIKPVFFWYALLNNPLAYVSLALSSAPTFT